MFLICFLTLIKCIYLFILLENISLIEGNGMIEFLKKSSKYFKFI